jgi:class 3 adenylate cyclase
MASPTRYARAGDVHIAWAELGDGPMDLVFCSAYVSHVEHLLAHPQPAAIFERLARFARVILFDRRGSGLSDRVLSTPTLEEQMQDVVAVMDAAGSDRAALLGFTGGGPLAVLAAATLPERCSALVLAAAFARAGRADNYEWPPSDEEWEAGRDAFFARWGDGSRVRTLFPSMIDDPSFVTWFGALERLSAGPGDARRVFELLHAVDVRHALPSVRVPTLVLHPDETAFLDVRHSEYLAARIAGARLARYPGPDALPVTRASRDAFIGEVEELLTGARKGSEVDRALATVMFTDIVGSTERAARVGDDAWTETLDRHAELVRRALVRWRGRAVKSMGDGFLATFDGPTSAVRCALDVAGASGTAGLPIRIGLHAGEVERLEGDVRGLAVHIGARISALAGPGEVLVSQTVKDLIVGSGIGLDDRGEHELKGVPGRWRVHLATGEGPN